MPEYLISYGAAGYLGQFRASEAQSCVRGDRVVIRSRRGLEFGTVLAAAPDGFGAALVDQPAGELLRLAGELDNLDAASTVADTGDAFRRARELAIALQLPIEIIDTELILDPRTLVVHYLGKEEFDPRPLVSTLSVQFDAYIELLDLTPPFAAPLANENGSDAACTTCGKPGGGCGTGGDCTSCGSGCGAGCSAANSNTFQEDFQAYFADLRAKMEKRFPIATV